MASSHFAPSVVSTTISDLDGWSIQGDYPYPMHPADPEEFGFDPTPRGVPLAKMEQTFTPPENNDDMMEFSFDPITKTHTVEPAKYESRALTLDRVAQAIPNSAAAISRYGQVTPPRSNSESSVEKVAEQKPTRQRRSTKASIKEEAPQPAPTGRKRRNTRKNSTAMAGNPEESEKRKQSLEKNRLAAAKCRINKKEKTEQLQRDSHEMAMTNTYLKETVMRMKEEVQQMNALLLSHAKCEGCKSPEDIQKHLNALGNGFLAHRMQGLSHDMFSFPGMPLDEHSDGEQDSYFSPATDPSLLNPPLPEFDREPEFDVSTPMPIE